MNFIDYLSLILMILVIAIFAKLFIKIRDEKRRKLNAKKMLANATYGKLRKMP